MCQYAKWVKAPSHTLFRNRLHLAASVNQNSLYNINAHCAQQQASCAEIRESTIAL